MLFFKKKKNEMLSAEYDKTKYTPALKCSICNGEQVAGFLDKDTGVFIEDTLIANDNDLLSFKKKYNINDLKKIY